MVNLLVIDFDFFFPNYADNTQHSHWQLYNWVYSERLSQARQNDIWVTRATDFLKNNLPLPKIVDNYLNFWSRFVFSPDSVLYYSDSNVYTAHPDVAENVTSVWLFDAHHDCGYNKSFEQIIQQKAVSCGDWMLIYWQRGARLNMRYPRWRVRAFEAEPEPALPVDRRFDRGRKLKTVFHKVALCRSGAWVPPWCESEFWNFLDKAPIANKICLQKSMQIRQFEIGEVFSTEG